MGLFRRDGHALELSLERRQADDLSAEEKASLEKHLSECEECQALARSIGEPVELPPLKLPERPVLRLIPGGAGKGTAPEPVVPVAPPVVPRSRRWWVVPMVAAAAVMVVVFMLPTEKFTRRGGGSIVMEVYRDTGGVSQRLVEGDEVAAGDTLGFRVQSDVDGYLMIYGHDGQGSVYPVYPQNPEAPPIVGSPDLQALPVAIQLDDTPGEESLIGVRCLHPFSLPQVTGEELPKGCVESRLRLHKKKP